MPSVPVSITLVRWTRRDAAEKLENFVFGSKFSGFRPPRGIDPEFVSYWIRESIKPDVGTTPIMRIAHALRFYERADVLDLLSRLLSRTDSTGPGFTRNAYILQCIGEVGSPEQKRFAAGLFNELLIPHPLAMQMFPLLLETAEVLAGFVDTTAIGRLMQRELDNASKAGDLLGPAGLNWRKYSDFNRNQLPEALAAIETKKRLLAADPNQRLQELIFIYLGEAPVSSPSMGIWAGRLIRHLAMNDGQPAVIAAFSNIIDGTLKSQMPKSKKEFLIHRAAQAIIYLQGKLSFPQEAAYDQIENGPENFLWDE